MKSSDIFFLAILHLGLFNGIVALHGQTAKVDSLQSLLLQELDAPTRTTIYIEIADAYRNISADSAMAYIDKAGMLLDLEQRSQLNAKFYFTKCKLIFINGKGEESLDNCNKALEALSALDSSELYWNIRMTKAKALFRMQEYQSAMDETIKIQKYAESTNDTLMLTNTHSLIGNIMRYNKRFDEALHHFERTAEFNQHLGKLANEARTLGNIAVIYSITEQFEKSVPYFKRVIATCEKLEDPVLEGFAHGNLGMNYIELEQPDSAEVHLMHALRVYKKMNNKYRIARVSSQVSRLHLLNEDYNKAIQILLPAYEQAKDLKDYEIMDDIAQNLADAYEGIGAHKNANIYLNDHSEYQDSILTAEVNRAISDAQEKYKTEKKEAEIELLSLEGKLNESKLSRQKIALAGLAVGLSLLSFLLYRIFGQKRKIESQNQFISTALKEKETLLKEIHHRVKNNLQVISSLLRIQSSHTTDEVAIDALREGQSRVQSMSLIHQDLYQRDNLTGISMKVYLERLARSLFDTYNVSADKIQLQTDIEDINLDVETVVPLGLVINELITNALKYAFPDEQSGRIQLILKEIDNRLHLTIADDGVGIENIDKLENSDSFGYSLINAFVNKLEAELIIESKNGTSISLIMEEYEKV